MNAKLNTTGGLKVGMGGLGVKGVEDGYKGEERTREDERGETD